MPRKKIDKPTVSEESQTVHEETRTPDFEESEPPTLLQSHYLSLLGRLLTLKEGYQDDPDREEWLLNAVNKSSYSAYCSCVEHGVGSMAKELLKG
jgi:hypothetical protein